MAEQQEKFTSHKARGGALGTAIAAILVYAAKEFLNVDLAPISEAIAFVLTMIVGGFCGTWLAPANRSKG